MKAHAHSRFKRQTKKLTSKKKKLWGKREKMFSSLKGHRLKKENVFDSQSALTGTFSKLWLGSIIRQKGK